jgi:hypothetical protein
MARKFKNNARTLLAGSGLAFTDTTMVVSVGTGDLFPAVAAPDFFTITLQNATDIEIVKVTERTAGSDSMTIVRAQEDTEALTWSIGDVASHRLTAAALAEFAAGNAAAISSTPYGNLSSATVQDALNELQADIDSRATAAALAAHQASSDPHPGVLGAGESDGEFRHARHYTSTSVWTKPSGLKRIRVTVVAGGAGKGYNGPMGLNGGGGGGACIKTIEASALGATELITVGAGGGVGVSGGSSSFGSHCSATGGSTAAGQGLGYNGDVNIPGIGGAYLYGDPEGQIWLGNNGFSMFMNGPGRGGTTVPGYDSGSAGVVIVEEFF